MFEHRNYPGSAGLICAFAAGLLRLFSVRKAMVASLIIVAAFCLLTWQRSGIWSNPDSMYRHMYTVHPDSDRLNVLFANINASAGEFGRARQTLSKVHSSFGRTMHQAYFGCLENGRVDATLLKDLRKSDRKLVEAHTTSSTKALVDAVIDGRCSASNDYLLRVLDFLLTSDVRGDEDRRVLYFAKADLLGSMQRWDDVIEVYLSAQAISDVYALPLYLGADRLAQVGRIAEARELLRQAASVEERSRIVRKDLAERIYAGIAEVYTVAGDDENAEALYREAMQSMPENPRFYVALAELLLGDERYNESREVLSRLRQAKLTGDPDLEGRIERLERKLDERRVR